MGKAYLGTLTLKQSATRKTSLCTRIKALCSLAVCLFASTNVAAAAQTVDILGFPCDPNAGWLYSVATFVFGAVVIVGGIALLWILSALMNSVSRALKTDTGTSGIDGGVGEHIFGWLLLGVGAVVCAIVFGSSSSCSQATRRMDSLWCFLDSRELNSFIGGPCSLRSGVEPPFSVGNADDKSPSGRSLRIAVDRSAARQIDRGQALAFLREIGRFPEKVAGHRWCSYDTSSVQPVGGGLSLSYEDLRVVSQRGPINMTTTLMLVSDRSIHCTVAIYADHSAEAIWKMALGAVQSLIALGASCNGELTGSWTRHYYLECTPTAKASTQSLEPVGGGSEAVQPHASRDQTYCPNQIAGAKARAGSEWMRALPRYVVDRCGREIEVERGRGRPNGDPHTEASPNCEIFNGKLVCD